jgi:hypothetical protein
MGRTDKGERNVVAIMIGCAMPSVMAVAELET